PSGRDIRRIGSAGPSDDSAGGALLPMGSSAPIREPSDLSRRQPLVSTGGADGARLRVDRSGGNSAGVSLASGAIGHQSSTAEAPRSPSVYAGGSSCLNTPRSSTGPAARSRRSAPATSRTGRSQRAAARRRAVAGKNTWASTR